MRVAFVATGGFDESGRERVIPSLLWLVERLAQAHDVVVYVLRHHDTPRSYRLAGATVRDLGRPSGAIRQYVALARALRADGPFDLVHAYWAQPAGRVAAPLARRLGVPSVVTLDSGEFVSIPEIDYGLQGSWRSRMSVAIATRLASTVTVCSRFQADLARARGVRPEVIPLGVDTRLFPARTLVPTGPPFRLLHVASLNPVKDQSTLLRALRHLVDTGLDVALDIVGEDTMSGRIQRLAAELGLEPHVRFHGFLPSAQLLPLYHRAHLFVLPSLHEAAGVVLLEAAACGVPAVGSNVGYLADWSPDAAVAVRPHDPRLLADAVRQTLENPDRRHRIALAAERWAREHDADRTALAFDALYRRLVNQHRARQVQESGIG